MNVYHPDRMKLKMPPPVWGPIFWTTLHMVALGYPEKPSYSEKKAAKEFFESLSMLLPCAVCKKHYAQHLALNPISTSLDRRQDLLKWTIDLHNSVNETLGKLRVLESEVIAYYKRLGERGRSPLWTTADFAEADMRARIQGLFVGGGVTLVACCLLYYTTKRE